MTNPTATMQRYAAFRRIMDAEGWIERGEFTPMGEPGQPTGYRLWDHPSGAVYDVTGRIMVPGSDRTSVGEAATWEEYLEAGVTPPPF